MVFYMKNSMISIRITSLYGSQPSSVGFAWKSGTFGSELQVYWSQTSPVDFWMQNSVLRSRMTLVYWSQPSSVVLCIQNSDFNIRITSLSRSQPSFVAFACKTAALIPELQVSMGPSSHIFLFFPPNQITYFSTRVGSLCMFQPSFVVLCIRNSDNMTRINSLYGS